MPDETPEEKTVPYKRFVAVNDEKEALRLWREETEPKLAAVSTLEAELAKTRTKLAAVEEEAQIYKHGVTDPEAVTVARALHAGLPEESRPPLPAWLGTLKADPAKAPKALQPYFAQQAQAAPPAPPAAPAAEPAAPSPAKPPAPPIAAGGAKPAPPPASKVTAADLASSRGTPEHAAVMAQWRKENNLPPKKTA